MNASSTFLAEERSQIDLELVSLPKKNQLHTPCSGRRSCSRSCARSRTPTVILFFRSAYDRHSTSHRNIAPDNKPSSARNNPTPFLLRQPCLSKSTYKVRSHVERNTHSARPSRRSELP